MDIYLFIFNELLFAVLRIIVMDQMADDELSNAGDVRSLKRIFSAIALDIYSHEMETNSALKWNSIILMGTLTLKGAETLSREIGTCDGLAR